MGLELEESNPLLGAYIFETELGVRATSIGTGRSSSEDNSFQAKVFALINYLNILPLQSKNLEISYNKAKKDTPKTSPPFVLSTSNFHYVLSITKLNNNNS